MTNDIAMLKLEPSVKCSANVQPICLPDPKQDVTNLRATVTGWGQIGNRDQPAVRLQESNTTIRSDRRCELLFNARGIAYIPPYHIRTYDMKLESTCYGDRGSPLFSVIEGISYIFGIASFGPSDCTYPNG